MGLQLVYFLAVTIPQEAPAMPVGHDSHDSVNSDSIAAPRLMPHLLGGAILIAIMSSVCFMAWNEPESARGLSDADKWQITYACLICSAASALFVLLRFGVALRLSRASLARPQLAGQRQ